MWSSEGRALTDSLLRGISVSSMETSGVTEQAVHLLLLWVAEHQTILHSIMAQTALAVMHEAQTIPSVLQTLINCL